MICSLPILDWILDHLTGMDIDVCCSIKREQYIALIGPNRAAKLHDVQMDYPKTNTYHARFEVNEFTRLHLSQPFVHSFSFYTDIFLKNQQRMFELNNLEKVFPAGNNQIANRAVMKGYNRITYPQYTLGLDEFTYPVMNHIPDGNIEGKYITINDGWGHWLKDDRPTKAWKPAAWRYLVSNLRTHGIKIVQIGSSDMGEDYDVDIQLRGKTTLMESMSVLKNAMLHVDVEGGLVHAKAAMGGISLVLMGPTNAPFFGYPQNINLTHGACQNCWHRIPNWNMICDQGIQTCMNHDACLVEDKIMQFVQCLE